MNASTAQRPANPFTTSPWQDFRRACSAGCWMLTWMGVSAVAQRRSFWTPENLMASIFHGNADIRRDFGSSTWSGLRCVPVGLQPVGGGIRVWNSHALSTQPGGGFCSPPCCFPPGWYFLWFHALGQNRDAAGLGCCTLRKEAPAFGHADFRPSAMIGPIPV